MCLYYLIYLLSCVPSVSFNSLAKNEFKFLCFFSVISVLIALVVYPVCFVAELNEGNRLVWEFGWAYGVGWGAAIFLFGAVILLLCDKESEEIYYKERKIVHENDNARA